MSFDGTLSRSGLQVFGCDRSGIAKGNTGCISLRRSKTKLCNRLAHILELEKPAAMSEENREPEIAGYLRLWAA